MGKPKSGIKVSIYNTPGNKEGGMISCARVITTGTKHMDEICKFISECSTVTSADIKGVLEALSNYIGRELSYGYSVELEGLGYFSPSVKSKQTVNKKGQAAYNTHVNGVNFRCSPRLKEMVKEHAPILVGRDNLPSAQIDGRKAKMLSYLADHPYINVSLYAGLNSCSRYLAAEDIKRFEKEGTIAGLGHRTHRIYVATEDEE